MRASPECGIGGDHLANNAEALWRAETAGPLRSAATLRVIAQTSNRLHRRTRNNITILLQSLTTLNSKLGKYRRNISIRRTERRNRRLVYSGRRALCASVRHLARIKLTRETKQEYITSFTSRRQHYQSHKFDRKRAGVVARDATGRRSVRNTATAASPHTHTASPPAQLIPTTHRRSGRIGDGDGK